MNRRGFLGSILALGAAPAIVRADSLMRIVPRDALVLPGTGLTVEKIRRARALLTRFESATLVEASPSSGLVGAFGVQKAECLLRAHLAAAGCDMSTFDVRAGVRLDLPGMPLQLYASAVRESPDL